MHAPPNFLDFRQFLRNFDKIVCWRPPEGQCPLLQGILDPPLHSIVPISLQLTQSNYIVDSNTKYSNYIKFQFKVVNYNKIQNNTSN